MNLETYIRNRIKNKSILLMTHIVIGYPNLEASLKLIDTMVAAGVDIMELQIPFSEPIADGPVILNANQAALKNGITVQNCLELAGEVARRHPIPFLFMSYYNIVFKYGVSAFTQKMKTIGLQGAIVPDLPPEEGREYVQSMRDAGLAPIFIFTPTTPQKRLEYIASHGDGFIYCVARKGVTGLSTDFSNELNRYLQNCRQATKLPLALGFGVKNKADVDFLRGKVDIAVIGTQTIRLMEEHGVSAVKEFIESLSL